MTDAATPGPSDSREPLAHIPTCSRAECNRSATWTVNWRNPRIHPLDRVKVWHACDEHVDYLRDYLAARDFPVLVAPLGTPVDLVPSPAPAAR
jgi:hypothetical protein